MSSSLAAHTFLARLRTSQLLTEEQLQASVAAAGTSEAELAGYLVEQGLLTRFQVRQLRAGSASLTIGKYVVVDCIGRGGNGIVLKARHRLLPDRCVALKTVDTRSLHRNEEALARFRREIDIVSRLDHPNVVRALDVIQTRTSFYLVLEFIAGRDLGAVVRERGPLPVPEAVDYVVQAARGLAYAHKGGIVHRDVKPTNLLLTEEGVVKLSDLGLARFCNEEPQADLTMKGLAIGTPEFMAPEQAEDASSVGPRSDLFSLGATLFHLLTGNQPIEGSSYLHKLTQLLTLPPRPLAQVRPDVPPGLAAVVDRLRSRNPAERPESAEAAIALLEPYCKSPAQAPPLTPGQLADLVLDVLKGKVGADAVCSRHGLSSAQFRNYFQTFIEGGRRALDPASSVSSELVQQLHAKIGAQAMEIEALQKQCGR